MKRHEVNMLEGALFPNIIAFAIPIVLTSLLQLLFNAADLAVVGRFAGSQSVAAVGATGSITGLTVSLFIGLSVGAGVSMARAIGRRDEEAVHRTVHTTLPLAILSGVILTIVGVCYAETFLTWMGTPPDVLPLSTLYMQIYFCGIVFNMIYNYAAALLRAVGDTKNPLIFLTLAGVLNVVLNVVFVTVLHMDVAGVAWATTISQALSAVLLVIVLLRRKDAVRLHLNKMRFYKRQLREILGTGLPAGLQSSLMCISNVVIQSSINSFGEAMMSASAAAVNIENFVLIFLVALSQAALNFTGQNAGARQFDRVKRGTAICMASSVVSGLVLCGLTYAFAPQLLSIYITDSPEAIAYGVARLAIMLPFYLVAGLHEIAASTLRGLGAAIAPMAIAVLGICGFRILWVETVFALPQFHTPDGLFVSYPISWMLTFMADMIVLVLVYRKMVKKAAQTHAME